MDDTMGAGGPEYEPVVLTCFACKAREEAANKFQQQDNVDLTGVRFGVRQVVEGAEDGRF